MSDVLEKNLVIFLDKSVIVCGLLCISDIVVSVDWVLIKEVGKGRLVVWNFCFNDSCMGIFLV